MPTSFRSPPHSLKDRAFRARRGMASRLTWLTFSRFSITWTRPPLRYSPRRASMPRMSSTFSSPRSLKTCIRMTGCSCTPMLPPKGGGSTQKVGRRSRRQEPGLFVLLVIGAVPDLEALAHAQDEHVAADAGVVAQEARHDDAALLVDGAGLRAGHALAEEILVARHVGQGAEDLRKAVLGISPDGAGRVQGHGQVEPLGQLFGAQKVAIGRGHGKPAFFVDRIKIGGSKEHWSNSV